jgi:hypothetical protein
VIKGVGAFHIAASQAFYLFIIAYFEGIATTQSGRSMAVFGCLKLLLRSDFAVQPPI